MDRIVKEAVLRAPVAKVWHAVSDAAAFGSWFGLELDGPIVAGARLNAKIVPTTVDPDVAKMQEPYRGTPFELVVVAVEPPHRLVWQWHPFAMGVDVSAEPMTTVTFALAEVPEGTRLTITESGFDALTAERRAKAMPANEGGWAHQLRLVEKWLAR